VSSISRCSSFGIIPRLSNNSRIESDKFFASSFKVFLNDSVLLLCSNSVYIKKAYKKYAIHLMGNTCYRAEHLISLYTAPHKSSVTVNCNFYVRYKLQLTV